MEQDFKSLYLGSKHDLTNSLAGKAAATSSSLSKESVAEVEDEQEMLLTLGPSKASKMPLPMCITIVLEILLVLLHGLHSLSSLPGGL